MFEEALAQMREISVRISGGSDALVHLNHVDAIPRHLFRGKRAQHEPGSVAAAYGHDEPAARRNGQPRLLRDHARGFFGDGVRVGQHFDVHLGLPRPTASDGRYVFRDSFFLRHQLAGGGA